MKILKSLFEWFKGRFFKTPVKKHVHESESQEEKDSKKNEYEETGIPWV